MTEPTDSNVYWPTHAYVPGHNERHPEDAFDAIKACVSSAMSVSELGESLAFRHGLMYLEHGYYWEAHEVFEPVWMVLPEDSSERFFIQGLIQLANAQLKLTMQRPNASRRLCNLARELIAKAGDDEREVMGVSLRAIIEKIALVEAEIELCDKMHK